MELLIDSADLKEIERLCCIHPVDGVTTNPSILAKSGRKPFEILRDIRSLIGDKAQLHAQVISSDAKGMTEEAHHILDMVPGNTLIKVPAIPEGIRAIKALAAEDVQVTATVIYSPMQAILAAKAGAAYAAPYVNRIENLGIDAVDCVAAMQDMIREAGLPMKLLGASFKNSMQVISLLRMGVEAVTLSPAVFDGLLRNSCVDRAVADFVKDFESLCGEGSTMMYDT